MRMLAVLAVSAAALSLPAAAFAQTASAQMAPAATATAPAAPAATPAATTSMAPDAAASAPLAAGAPATAASASTSADLDKIECRTTAPPTGTRLGGGRECHTVRQWNERMQDSQRALIKEQQTGFRGSSG